MAETTKSRVIVVNEDDKITGYKGRDILKNDDIYRVSALWITNSHGEILLARRHRNKPHHPGKWGPAVSGTVNERESYKENMIKETEEELGLKNIKLRLGPKIKIDSKYHHFTQWYTLTIDKNISELEVQEDEVEEIKWFLPGEFKKQLDEHPEEFLPTMKKYSGLFMS